MSAQQATVEQATVEQATVEQATVEQADDLAGAARFTVAGILAAYGGVRPYWLYDCTMPGCPRPGWAHPAPDYEHWFCYEHSQSDLFRELRARSVGHMVEPVPAVRQLTLWG